MMNTAYATTAVLAGMLLAAGAIQKTSEPDLVTTASIAPSPAQDGFRLVSTAGEADCLLAVGYAPEGRMRPLRLAPGCVADNPELAGARYWLDRPDGAIAFSGADGNIVAEFAAADGAAFESYYPARPVMTLLALD